MLPTSSPSVSRTTRAAPSAEPRTCATAATSASLIRVPSASFGGFASIAWTALGLVVKGSATVGFELKNTIESGWPGFREAKVCAARIAELIDPFMLFDESIRSTVPIPSAEAEERTLTLSTGLLSSVTFTSSVVSAELRGFGSVRTYARSGNRAVPASTTCKPPWSAADAGIAAMVARRATVASAMRCAKRLTVGGPRRSSARGGARTGLPAARCRASRTCRGRPAGDPSTGASR